MRRTYKYILVFSSGLLLPLKDDPLASGSMLTSGQKLSSWAPGACVRIGLSAPSVSHPSTTLSEGTLSSLAALGLAHGLL